MVCLSIALGLILVVFGCIFTWRNEANLVCTTGAYDSAKGQTHELLECSMNQDESDSFVHFTCPVQNEDLVTTESSTGISAAGAYKLTFLTEQYGYIQSYESQTKRKCDRYGECEDESESCSCLRKGWTTSPVTKATASSINYCDQCTMDIYLDIPSADTAWGDSPPTKLGSLTKYADNVPLGDGTLQIGGADISLIKNQPVIPVPAPLEVIEKNSFSLTSSEYCGATGTDAICYNSIVKRQQSSSQNVTSIPVGKIEMGDLRMTVKAYGSQQITALGKQVINQDIATITSGSFGKSIIPPCNAHTLLYLINGSYDADTIYERLQNDLNILTSLFRILSFLMIGLGFRFFFSPLQSSSHRLPFIGSSLAPLVGCVLHIFTSLLTIALWFTVFALAWVFYRPLYGMFFLTLAGMFIMAAYKLYKKNAYEEVAVAEKVVEMESMSVGEKEMV